MTKILNPSIIALIAAISSVVCARIGIPVWYMFAGWIAFVAGGMHARTAVPTFLCAVLGILLGIIGSGIISGASETLGVDLALLVGVFAIVLVALLAQHAPLVNQVVCYFVGMTAFFASGLPPALGSSAGLLGGLLLGVVSGLAAVEITSRIASPGTNSAS